MRDPVFNTVSQIKDVLLAKIEQTYVDAARRYGKISAVCPYPVRARQKGQPYMRPCGQCVHCKVVRRKELVGRCVAENETTLSMCATLTLSDLGIKKRDWNTPEAWQLEIETFRRRIQRRTGIKPKVRWTAEHGEDFDRPHAHALVFGVPPEWVPTKRQDYLDVDWWKHGYVSVDNVTNASAGYVVGYLTDEDKAKKRIKSAASKNIGREYLERWIQHMHEGMAKHGHRYENYPDENGKLPYASFEIDHKSYPLDASWREIVRQHGLLDETSANRAEIETYLTLDDEITTYGGPVAAQVHREWLHEKNLREHRERQAIGETAEIIINGFRHKI